jgi:hypothetical protein
MKKYNEKKCKMCGKDYQPNSGVQKYCPKCRVEKKNQLNRGYNHKYYLKNIVREAKRKHEWYISPKNYSRIREHQKAYLKAKKLKR